MRFKWTRGKLGRHTTGRQAKTNVTILSDHWHHRFLPTTTDSKTSYAFTDL
jgi:hypothetical protein